MKTLRELYSTNEAVKQGKSYMSISYQMTRFDEPKMPELDKTFYIKDLRVRRDKVREILKNKLITSGYVPPRETERKKTDFFTDTEYINILKVNRSRLFYGGWVWTSIKRELEIQTYLDEIIDNANKINNDFDKICFLIDEKYRYP